MSERAIKYPFEHPAAGEAIQLFLTIRIYSEEDYRRLPRRDRFLWDVRWFETEVSNGGVDQYFYNSTGDHAQECLEALKEIGAKRSYELLNCACDLFPAGRPSPNREIRRRQLGELIEAKHIDDLMIDDLISGEIEVDLYQYMLDYFRNADPKRR